MSFVVSITQKNTPIIWGYFYIELCYSLLFNHLKLADNPAIFCDLHEV